MKFCVRCDIELNDPGYFVHHKEEVLFSTRDIEHAEPLCDMCYQTLQRGKRRGRRR